MGEKLFNDELTGQVIEFLKDMDKPIEILYFGQKDGCETCEPTLQLVKELSELSDKISLSVYDIQADAQTAQRYNATMTPCLVLVGKDDDRLIDYGVRFNGIPAMHEFTSLMNDIIWVSKRDSGLSPDTREYVKTIKEPLHFLVFATPTCPYCPRAVMFAHQLAIESPLIQADMIEANEFPEISEQFGVHGVPQISIIKKNDGAVLAPIIGGLPEKQMISEIKELLG